MNTNSLMKHVTAIGFAVAAGWMAVATAAEGGAPQGQKTIRVLSVTGGDAASPQAAAWRKAPATQVALQTAFPGHPSIVGTAQTQQLTAQAVRVSGKLYVKLRWNDRTANREMGDTNQFLDRVAVQFPYNGKADTTPFMGDGENAVDIWHWRADGRTENLLANGFGTATRGTSQEVTSTATRRGGVWEVVLARSLTLKEGEGITMKGRKSIPIAFAVWDGANQERDGLKAVTLEWWELRF